MNKWEQNIRQAVPYVPGEQPGAEGIIKINTNENPYPPSGRVQKLLSSYNNSRLRLYPETNAAPLRDRLAGYYSLKPEQVFVGVGSDDVLAMSFLTFFNSEKPILFPDITYSFYKVWASLYKIPYNTPAVNRDLMIQREDYYIDNGGIVIANPNAPTGISENLEFIEDIMKMNQDSVVIIDEAYVDFGGCSAVPLINKYENLLIVQTFSKARSMAGMRIGYAMGNKKLIKALNNVKHSYNSYTMNQLSIACGIEAVEDDEYFKDCLNKVIHTRERIKGELEKLGFYCTDSKTNFLFAKHEKADAEGIFNYLKEHLVYVRHFKSPVIDEYLRISIGTDEEMDTLLDITRSYLLNFNS